MNKLALLLLTLLSLGSHSFASTMEFGNGGNVILCPSPDGKSTKATFYDTYEAWSRYQFPAVFPLVGSCEIDDLYTNLTECGLLAKKMASIVAARIKPFDASMEKEIQKSIREFWNDTRFVSAKLFPVEDSGLGFIPEGCHLEQIAIQHNPISPEDRTYFISMDLFRLTDTPNQAALILHEVLYKYARSHNHNIRYSEGVRYFNGLLISDYATSMNKTQFTKAKKTLLSD